MSCRARLLVFFFLLRANLHPVANAARFHPKFNLPTRRNHNDERRASIEKLKELVPPPNPREVGGEKADDAAYARFLAVADWDPAQAAPKLQQSFKWRKRIRPGTLRPRHFPKLCRQQAWVALLAGEKIAAEDVPEEEASADARARAPLEPPHHCPPLRSWRTTRHGLPVTYFRCWKWRPDKASSADLERHLAYHMHHLIRRTPRNVSRICIVFDMRGFQSWMLQYIHQAVKVLRNHYPGRAGAMCFINAPGYFYTVWKIISPWLDDEIRSKVFFAPKEVNDVEKTIKYLNKMKLKTGPA